ncbi:hypothetical protein CLV63_103378 [Murinocardiopsis flavida]|uniref:SAM-dependent chlorinase/fluorinase n=1 Tax=Murinocardiopsis flavida TaxID=645275 RepID=A0A2P8DR05_9ACTN|nr:SAM-dependent chlorinase/fluorinase [Murinocardiopsis flavida]PSK99652.1 hypothetical protein CLV63_103378 [Murinocardiopsis flavida]
MSDLAGYSYLSFLTDYGRADGFVAVCHGQMLLHAPRARVIDITHDVPPGDIRRGAAVLAEAVADLPPGVHVAVVDPGVGTERRSVAVAAGGHVLVGPDNGLLAWAADTLGGGDAAVELTEPALWRHPVSATFHGRDVYAPVGARIAAGLPVAAAGRPLPAADLRRLPDPVRTTGRGTAEGEVHTIDRFGNCQLSLRGTDIAAMCATGAAALALHAHGTVRVLPLARTFGDAGPGELLLLTDSAGRLAVAENGGSAACTLGLAVADRVGLTLAPDR